MSSYHNFIFWLNQHEMGRQLHSLLEVTITEDEDIVFLKSERDHNNPIIFLIHNKNTIVNGTIDFFNDSPIVQFNVRKTKDIVQKQIKMMSVPHQVTSMSRFRGIVLEITFQDGSQLLLDKLEFGTHGNSFITTVQSLLKC